MGVMVVEHHSQAHWGRQGQGVEVRWEHYEKWGDVDCSFVPLH